MILVARNLKEELLEYKEVFRRQCGGLPIVKVQHVSEPFVVDSLTITLRASRRFGRGSRLTLVTEWFVNDSRIGENALFGKLRKLGLLDS